jgi:DNA-binding protein H-NS
MAKIDGLEEMSYAELGDLRHRIDRLMLEKQHAARNEMRQKVIDMLKAEGLSVEDVFGKGRRGKGSVAVKYRDPKNPQNTWTGRGRMPRWLAAATKGRKARKEDFLV